MYVVNKLDILKIWVMFLLWKIQNIVWLTQHPPKHRTDSGVPFPIRWKNLLVWRAPAFHRESGPKLADYSLELGVTFKISGTRYLQGLVEYTVV